MIVSRGGRLTAFTFKTRNTVPWNGRARITVLVWKSGASDIDYQNGKLAGTMTWEPGAAAGVLTPIRSDFYRRSCPQVWLCSPAMVQTLWLTQSIGKSPHHIAELDGRQDMIVASGGALFAWALAQKNQGTRLKSAVAYVMNTAQGPGSR